GVRINAGYQKDWLDKSVGPGDQGLVSNAHLEVRDQLLDWGARLGRQSLQRDGVLGRFDGLRADYRWRPRVTFNVTAGLPVDSPRYAADTNRQFVAASVDIEGFAGWDFNAYTYQQKNDGLWDRQAIGGEVQYQNQRVNLMGTVDYDVSYGALNSALLIGNWRLHERFEVTGRANLHALPFLTSRNALIGQPVSTIDLLLDTYSAAQIRTIARNRTTDAQNASLGLAITLSERWYFNGDAGYSAIDETIASAGVEGLAASGPQLYYSARLIGSSVFRNGDTTIVGFRLGSTERADTSTLSLDLRLPFGRSFRLSPRLAVSWRDASPQGEQQLIAEPSVRLVYQARRRYRLEVEAGGRWSARDLPDALLLSPLYPDEREESLGYYFNLRWGVDF
ncbi:MAG: hypothetical protein OES38_16100, partial [Gammaproteobacteria bacterium]|nr:hypothetical protein [Gammaproteobacteria bacterium]